MFEIRCAALAVALLCAAAPLQASEGLPWHQRAASWRTSVTFATGAADPQWTVTIARRASPPIETASLPAPKDARQGIASFYWQEQMTASGERFDKRDLTAAHRTLPMGTKVRVTNIASGRTVTVRINDRGPFVQGRVIDLSEAAADAIGMRSAGLAPVRLDVVHD